MNHTAGVPAGVTPSTTGACATYANGGSISSGTVTINGCKITGRISITGGAVTDHQLRPSPTPTKAVPALRS